MKIAQITLRENDEDILKEIALKKQKMPLSRKLFIICMITYPILQFLVFWVYVNFNSILMAFQTLDYMSQSVKWVGFDNFVKVWNDLINIPDLLNCIKNSVILFLNNNFILLPISIFCAYIFFKKLPGNKIFRVIFFLPNIISIVVLTMSFSFMFENSIGPINSVLRNLGLESLIPTNGWLSDKSTAFPMVLVYCIWAGIGYNVVLLSGAINRIPTEIIEAGKLDGISAPRELFNIVIPLIFPTISTLFITGVTVIFTLFLQPQLLTGGGPYEHISGTIAMYIIEKVNANQLYEASCVGLIFSVIGIPLVLGIKKILDLITPDVNY